MLGSVGRAETRGIRRFDVGKYGGGGGGIDIYDVSFVGEERSLASVLLVIRANEPVNVWVRLVRERGVLGKVSGRGLLGKAPGMFVTTIVLLR